jgi:transcription antitermination factor NusG
MSWFVLHLRPRSEKKVAQVCEINGLEYYLPLRTETKIYQRRKVTVKKPMFPGYMFVAYEGDQKVCLLRTNHVIHILEPPSEDLLVHQLDQIKKALEVDETLGAEDAIKKGRRVIIKAGPFMGIEGVIDYTGKPGVVRLNIEMIGQAVVVEIDRDYIEIVD